MFQNPSIRNSMHPWIRKPTALREHSKEEKLRAYCVYITLLRIVDERKLAGKSTRRILIVDLMNDAGLVWEWFHRFSDSSSIRPWMDFPAYLESFEYFSVVRETLDLDRCYVSLKKEVVEEAESADVESFINDLFSDEREDPVLAQLQQLSLRDGEEVRPTIDCIANMPVERAIECQHAGRFTPKFMMNAVKYVLLRNWPFEVSINDLVKFIEQYLPRVPGTFSLEKECPLTWAEIFARSVYSHINYDDEKQTFIYTDAPYDVIKGARFPQQLNYIYAVEDSAKLIYLKRDETGKAALDVILRALDLPREENKDLVLSIYRQLPTKFDLSEEGYISLVDND